MSTRLDRAAFLRATGVIALAAPAVPALALGRFPMNERLLGGGFSLLKILKNVPELSGLLKLIEKETHVLRLLEGGGGLLSGLTLFAPDNDALKNLPGGVGGIQDLLKTLYSVIAPEALLLEQLLGGPLDTLSKIPLDIRRKNGSIFADEAKLLKGNIIGTNGVIHIIDTVPARIL